MPTLTITFTKGAGRDVVEIARASGAVSRFEFPHKGPIPHDYVHVVVEEALGLTRGFWGMVAGGADPEAVAALASAAGHPSAKRARVPDPEIVELLQAERVVECFEADLWGGPAEAETFRSVVDAACAASFVPAPPLDDAAIGSIRQRIAEFGGQWRLAQRGAQFKTVWRG